VLAEYFRAVKEAPDLAASQRLLSYAVLGLFMLRHLPKLGRDVIIATEQIINLILGKGYHHSSQR
jgi:hypothetical protein